ncbi:allantoinase [Pullulanibacillus pueri]|uniref:allantoinase n=1 Tax=Pullulanibacillus pueri TaxID=1437324 RepID=A0A8J2ZZM9_9BACL|nr:allantoinase AllB [Pullulanibacillus pueri]MBM7684089.1 allantoinase [Pullulanibacillus pueri]GGH88624.1 allantoinase [Pullulanibacillus pueri]
MQYDLIIKNGEVVTSQNTFSADIGVSNGKIVDIGMLDGAQTREVYDAKGKYVFPGFIDEHVHSRDPGLTHKEDFTHLTQSAAAGGVTTVIEMPNTVPPVSDEASFYSKVEHLSPKAFVDFALLGMVLGDLNTKKLQAMADAGVVGFKLFWGYYLNPKTLELVYNPSKGDDVLPPPDDGQIFDAFHTIGQTGKAVCIHAENSAVISRMVEIEKNKGKTDYLSFLSSRPSFTEALTIQTGITIANAAGAHLHILHIAAGEGVDLVAEARNKGMKVTGETCPHYLTLTDQDYPRAGVNMKIYPPIREASHQDRLWQGVQQGHIQAIGSDHAPHTEEEKVGDIWNVPAGATGVQTIVPVMLDSVAKGKITLNQLASLLSEAPARIWGLYGKKGVIQPNADADFTIVDMNATMTIRKDDLLSKSQVTPYDGLTMKGAPVASFIRGRQVMSDGKLVGERIGEFVKPVGKSEYKW